VDYPEAIRWLYALAPRGMRYELDRMEAAVALRGHPERRVPAIHVAGTNGKGSVSVLAASALRAGGRRVGLFTSPHLHRFPERILIDGNPVAEAEVARRVTELRAFLDAPDHPPLSFFEVTTMLAFEVFADAGCDVAVYEVGLGGRLDATNVILPEATAITRIALDHTRILGPDLPSIAREKAGIAKPGVPMVCGVRGEPVRDAIRGRADASGAGPLRFIDDDFRAEPVAGGTDHASGGRVRLTLGPERRVEDVSLGLPGAHQRDNAAVAAALLDDLGRRCPSLASDDDAIRRGFAAARWPGRLEWLPGTPPVLLDAAHNADGSRALAAYLDGLRAGAGGPVSGPIVLVFGVLEDKAGDEMAAALVDAVDGVWFARPPVERGRDADELVARFGGRTADGLPDILAGARADAGPSGLVVVAGSLFLVAAVRAALLGIPAEPAVRG